MSVPEIFRKVDLYAEWHLELIFFTLHKRKLRGSMISMYLHKDLNFDNGSTFKLFERSVKQFRNSVNIKDM